MVKVNKKEQNNTIEEIQDCVCPNCEAFRLIDPIYNEVVERAIIAGAFDVLYQLAIYLNETNIRLNKTLVDYAKEVEKQKNTKK